MNPVVTSRPFTEALRLESRGDGRYRAELGELWAIGGKAHGGLLLALLVRSALTRIDAESGRAGHEPLAVAADFLRAPDPGPVELTTEVLKLGRTASVATARLTQGGRPMLAGSVTAGRLAEEPARWADLSDLGPLPPAVPPADAVDPGAAPGRSSEGLAAACELRFDAAALAFARGETGDPRMTGWIRPRGEDPDVLFALVAGDALPPTVFNLDGRVGWTPTVQLTALLRARPAPGWLRCASLSRTVTGSWFDEDCTVVDAAGRIVCQSRQLALAPLPG